MRKYYSAFSISTAYYIIASLIFIVLNGCTKTDNFATEINANEISSVKASEKTNVILMLVDDIGYEIPTCNGGQTYSTPRLDKMAAEGMRFTQCYSSPLCSPSRNMLVTGKYGFRNYKNWGSLDVSNRTIANMLHDNAYKTLVAGKWQFDGGDKSAGIFGFDDHVLYAPFELSGVAKGSKYKDPTFFKSGKLLPASYVKGKYGEDILVDYVSNFIDNNKNNPFFIYYPITLCHYPFCPTPDDAEYATWDNKTSKPDIKYFPSMVKYMDKKIGEVIDKVNAAGLAQKTVIIVIGDNGTDARITSMFNNSIVRGGKSQTYNTGTNVPMIVWAPGKVAPGSINNNLIDFTDFLPTIADIAKVPRPKNYGPLDGVSFYPNLIGQAGTPRKWVFCHYDQNEGGAVHPIKRWVNNAKYRLYESPNNFYNTQTDPFEKKPIPDSKLTPEEKTIKAQFQTTLSTMHN